LVINFHDRPITSGPGGTYAHYSLLNGLIGNSIGSVSKDVWFYIDKLVEKFPGYFGSTVLDKQTKMSDITEKFMKYEKDLSKWR
jgi:hypothetical protein